MRFIKSLIFLLSTSSLQSQSDDQLLILFGSSGYVLHKVLDFANDHGFRYIQIVSYEFHGFGHKIKGSYEPDQRGHFFELKDDIAVIAFLCFQLPPLGSFIDLEKYHYLIEN
jgi:hypothetical protein